MKLAIATSYSLFALTQGDRPMTDQPTTPTTSSPKSCAARFPSHRVYEDDDVVAFMDVMPQADGHTLVIPKAPSRNLLDADPATLGRADAGGPEGRAGGRRPRSRPTA